MSAARKQRRPDGLRKPPARPDSPVRRHLWRLHYNLGSVLSQIPGRLPEAISHYEAALRIRPDPQLQQKVDRLRAGER
jgi:hypothetical protein